MKSLLLFLVVLNLSASECVTKTYTYTATPTLDSHCDWEKYDCKSYYFIDIGSYLNPAEKTVVVDGTQLSCSVHASFKNQDLISRATSLDKGHKIVYIYRDGKNKTKGEIVWKNPKYLSHLRD